MNALEGVGGTAEVLAWIVLMIGLSLVALGMILRLNERGLVPTEILIVEEQHELRVRWFASGEIYERRLGATERPPWTPSRRTTSAAARTSRSSG